MSAENIEALLAQVARVKVDKLLLQGVTLSRDSTLLLTDSLASLPTNFSSITHVDVSNTGIEIEGFHALCDALAALPDVQVLVAKDNGLPKEAGLAVAKVLRAGKGLTVLDLSHNMLSDVGVAAICGAILADESDHAASLHSDAATAVDEMETRPLPFRLRSLGLAGNQMTDNGLQKLCHSLGELIKLHQDLGSGNYRLPLTELQLGFNRLGDEGARKLARFFNMHMDALKLEHIDLSHAGMTARGVSLILSALATSCRTLSTLSIKGNGSVNIHVLHALTRLLVEAPALTSLQCQLSKQNCLDLLADKEAVAAIQQLAEAAKQHSNLHAVDFGEMEQTVDGILKSPSGSARSVSFGATKSVHSVLSALKTIRRATQHRRNLSASSGQSSYTVPDAGASIQPPQTPSPLSSPGRELVHTSSTAEFSRARDEQRKAFRTLSEEVMKLIPALEQLTSDIDRPVSSTHSLASNDLDFPNHDIAGDGDDLDIHGNTTGSRYSMISNPAERPPPTSASITSNAQDPTTFARELAMLAAKQALELYREKTESGDKPHPEMEKNSENIERLTTKVANLSAQMEVIQERLADLDSWVQQSSGDIVDDLAARVVACERKIDALEGARAVIDAEAENGRTQFGLAQVEDELAAAVEQKTQPVTEKLNQLTKRLLTLEQAVESEHETSLHVLSTILNQRKRNLPPTHQDSDAFIRSSDDLHQHISSMLSAAQSSHATPLLPRSTMLLNHSSISASSTAATATSTTNNIDSMQH